MLISQQAADTALSDLSGGEFYNKVHRRLFRCMKEIADTGTPIDFVTVTERLRVKGWLSDGEPVSYMANMARSTPSASSVEHYIKIVKGVYAQREIIAGFASGIERARQLDDPSEIIASTQAQMEALTNQTITKKPYMHIKDLVLEVCEDMEAKSENPNGEITGVPSGFTDLDRMTAGFQNSDLIIVAARPSVGKTALALNIGRNAAQSTKKYVAIFSLEMSNKQLVGRMICAEGNIDSLRFRTGKLTDEDWEMFAVASGKLAEMPILIDDTPAISVTEIRAKCRKIKRDHGLGMILIDYLQLITGIGNNRQEEVSYISRILKQIARELDVPVIALSQLSRGVEQRQDKRPMMSDLRESGSIEQDADIVAFLYRDDYYDKESEKKNIIEIIIAKQRNGPVGTVELAFLKQFNKFVNLDRTHHESKEQSGAKKQTNVKPDSWWKVLEVSKNATSAEIEKAFRVLTKKYHPDTGGSNELMSRLNRAMEEAREAV